MNCGTNNQQTGEPGQIATMDLVLIDIPAYLGPALRSVARRRDWSRSVMRRGGSMKARGLTALIALPVAVALGVSACGTGGSTSDSSSTGGIVTVGIAEPEHLVPSNTVETNGFQVLSALYTPLVKFDEQGKPAFDQAAASSIESPDKKVWTVKLRRHDLPRWQQGHGEQLRQG